MMFTADDRVHMGRALELAGSVRYTSKPNPAVGCVIVRGGQVLGEGATQPVGGNHAEIQAILDAVSKGNTVEGATVYVTLEPCSHVGRTPPCADRLIREKVSRVVVGTPDPNPLVNGQGIQRLRQAGVDVQVGLFQEQSREINLGFFSRFERNRPWVRLKMACSMDGKTALPNGKSQWITGRLAREDGHRYRALSGAVVTGIGTVLADNPQMTVRLPGVRCPQPVRVVVDSCLRTPADSAILGPDCVVCTCRKGGTARESLSGRCELWDLPEKDGQVDLHALMHRIGDLSVNDVLVEAGSILSGAFLREGLVDEVVVYLSACFIGPGREVFRLPERQDLLDLPRWDIHSFRQLGPDIKIVLRKKV